MDNYTIPTVFGDVAISPVGPHDRPVYISPIEYKISYINNLPVDVTVGYRSGLKFVLNPQRSMFSSRLVVRVEILIRDKCKTEIQSILSAITEDSTPELKAFKEAYTMQIQYNAYGNISLIVDYSLDIEKLRKLGGTIYFHELDIVISIDGISDCLPHPFSEEGRKLQLLCANKEDNEQFVYNVKLIDNLGKYGPRDISIGGKVYKVETSKDGSKRDGVYITTNKAVSTDTVENTDDKEVTFYPIDSEDIELFKTYEEALTLGDSVTSRKKKVADLELIALEQKRELQDVKHQNELLIIEKNKEKVVIEEERERHKYILEQLRRENEERLESERARQKDYYDNRSYQRKEQSEIIKWIPSLITGAAVIIGAIFKVASSSSK